MTNLIANEDMKLESRRVSVSWRDLCREAERGAGLCGSGNLYPPVLRNAVAEV